MLNDSDAYSWIRIIMWFLSLQTKFISPRLSPVQYSLAVQTRGLRYQLFIHSQAWNIRSKSSPVESTWIPLFICQCYTLTSTADIKYNPRAYLKLFCGINGQIQSAQSYGYAIKSPQHVIEWDGISKIAGLGILFILCRNLLFHRLFM